VAKYKSKTPDLPPQFQKPAPGKLASMPDTKGHSLYSYLSDMKRRWADSKRAEIIPTLEKCWRNFNSLPETDDTPQTSRGKKPWRSDAFHPLTEQKVMAGVSQMDDVLFREGKFPYAYKTSPITDAGLDTITFDRKENEPLTEEEQKIANMGRIAKRKMRLMKRVTDDQFAECSAVEEARSMLFSAALYGTAAVESPIVVQRTRNKWDGDKLTTEKEDAASFKALDIWLCWPDPDCGGDVQKGRGFFTQTDYMLQDILSLRDQVFEEIESEDPEFDYIKDNFDALILSLQGKTESNQQQPEGSNADKTYVEDRPWLKGNRGDMEGVFPWIKFAGSVPNRFLRGIIEGVTDDGKYSEIIAEYCNGYLVKAALNPFPKQRRPFHLVPLTKIPGSCWGRGVAQKIFDHQENINRLIRQYIDNKRLSGNLMTAIDRDKLKEGEGLEIYPGRNWEFDQGYGDTDVRKLIQQVSLQDVTEGVLEAIQMFMMWADAASGIPRILEGSASESGATAYAENQRIIAASKQLGLMLKNLDTFGWVPIAESFYDWNMEFGEDDRIKGEFQVIATGFSSFENKNMKKLDLERMMLMAQQNPLLGNRIKAAPLLEDWFQTSSLDTDRYLLTEIEAQ